MHLSRPTGTDSPPPVRHTGLPSAQPRLPGECHRHWQPLRRCPVIPVECQAPPPPGQGSRVLYGKRRGPVDGTKRQGATPTPTPTTPTYTCHFKSCITICHLILWWGGGSRDLFWGHLPQSVLLLYCVLYHDTDRSVGVAVILGLHQLSQCSVHRRSNCLYS